MIGARDRLARSSKHGGREVHVERLDPNGHVEPPLAQFSRPESAGIDEVDARPVVEPQDHPRVLRLVLTALESQPTRHPQVNDERSPIRKIDSDVLPAAPDGFDPRPGQLVGTHLELGVEHLGRCDGLPGSGSQSAHEGLDLREFRHVRPPPTVLSAALEIGPSCVLRRTLPGAF